MKKILLIALCPFLFVGCAHLTIQNDNLTTHVQPNPIRGDGYKLQKSFEINKWNHYYFLTLVPEEQNLQALLSEHVKPGEIVTDFKIEKQTTFVNGLICGLVGIVYCPDTLKITGNVYSR